MNIENINKEFQNKSVEDIIRFVNSLGKKLVITTNFRPYEVAILHAVTNVIPDIDVIWCDTGYNTLQTYEHADYLIDRLNLNIDLYVPKQTAAHRNAVMGIPDIDSPLHATFTQQVKLEPFKRAMAKHQPDIWFTNLRKGQTVLRDSLDIFSKGNDGIIKASPFYHWTDTQLDAYLSEHDLPNEFKYYDPTKVLENRECGLHSITVSK